MATVASAVNLPPEVTITAYERHGPGHGFEVSGPWPQRCPGDRCHREDKTYVEFKDSVPVIRDLDIWGEPSFWIDRPAYHRGPWCNHRQFLIPPFQRKDASYPYRLEQHGPRLLIGSTEEEVARRLGISAEMMALMVSHQLAEAQAQAIDAQRVLTDLGIDE